MDEKLVLYRYRNGDVPRPEGLTKLQMWARRRGNPDTRQWGTGGEIAQSVTEYDSFPYTRWWRGVPGDGTPVVHPRIAGWYPRQDSAYRINQYAVSEYDRRPHHCFQASCSQKLPSTGEYRTARYNGRGRKMGRGGCGGDNGCENGDGCGCGASNIYDSAAHSSIVVPP